jgi:phenylacetate-coenzyme A ligase PaaK-like adenylate-forming protein
MFLIGKIRLLQPLKFNSKDILMSLDTGGTPLGISTTIDACAICYNVKILPAGVLPIQKKVELIQKHSVTSIVGLPDMIVSIGKLLQSQKKINNIKKIISVGKSIKPYITDLLELFPNAKIQNDIGSSELSAFSFLCEHKKLHFNIDLTHISVGSNGIFNSTGLTSANPIFNYQTGDAVINFRYEHCNCGSCLTIIDNFVER